MATIDYSKMTTKKLNALLAVVSDSDREVIRTILNAREGIAAGPAPQKQVSPEEKGQGDTGDGAQGKPRMSDAERTALADELREKFTNHKCQVVPFNTVEWVEGVIKGVVEDRRMNKVLLAIILDDGRRIVKVHDSKLLRIMDEVVIPEKRPSLRNGEKRGPWTPEKMEADMMEAAVHVGKVVTVKDGDTTVEGRIVTIVLEKRSQRCLYRIEVAAPTEEDPGAVRLIHKVSVSADLVIPEDFDEKGKDINTRFIARKERAAAKSTMTPAMKVALAEEAFRKAESTLESARASFETRRKALEAAKAEYDKFLKAEAESLM